MCFTLKRDRIPFLTIDGELIEVVSEYKYLGMVFDAPRLSWNRHVNYTRSKGQKGVDTLKCLSSTKWGADRTSLQRIGNAIVIARLCYDSPALISLKGTI